MAQPTSPTGEPMGDGKQAAGPPVDEPTAAPRSRDKPVLLQPPTEAELARTGEPTLDEIHAAASGTQADAVPAADTEVVRPAETEVIRPAETEVVRPAETEVIRPAETEQVRHDSATTVQPVVAHPAPPSPAEPQPVLAPAAESAPPPRKHGNRLVGTAWVLLAAGLFQVLYFGALALIVLLLGGAASVVPGLQNVAAYPFAWLPVLFFFLLFELTVLLFNRAGRFAYVIASLIVGLLVYVLSVLLISILIGGGIGDTATLARAFESPEFILTGLVAREVMLWTGFAIGSRGIRVRRRDKEARKRYEAEVADAGD
jgi:hypothetical protein